MAESGTVDRVDRAAPVRAALRQVDDLEVEVSHPADRELEVRILRSPFNRPRAPFRSPYPEGKARQAAEELGSWVNEYIRQRGIPKNLPAPDAEDTGRRLFEALFPADLARTYELCSGTVLRADEPRALRLRVSFDTEAKTVNEVAVLPWELLREPERGQYLALDPRTPIVRYLDSSEPLRPTPTVHKLRVLLVAANPSDARQVLDLETEKRGILEAASRSECLEIEILPEPTLDSLDAALREHKSHVLHFMGHGGFDDLGGYVAFEDPQGKKRTVTDRLLATLIPRHRFLRLVVLAACKGAKISRGLGADFLSGVAAGLTSRGLAAVLGMQFVVSDEAASCFSRAFYASLARGELLEEALTEGRLAILRGDGETLEWASPVLFLRILEGRLVELEPETKASAEAPPGPRMLGIFSIGKESWGRPAWEAAKHRLDLSPYFGEDFKGRYIRNEALWPVVAGEIERFLPDKLSRSETNVLEMAAHFSVAYAAGRTVEAMAGYKLVFRQRGLGEPEDWRHNEGEVPGLWKNLEARELEGPGNETALAISISQNLLPDVETYLASSDPSTSAPPVGRLLVAELEEDRTAIKSGAHAYKLAEKLFQWVRDQRRQNASGPLHLFLSGPVGFAFFLGRLTRDWGEVQLYEHDRDGKVGTLYFPSLRVGGTE